ncbi:hypothetical protein [Staphylococcus aureus]|nr:hypothetical protein [Staphylococcus aureus]
MKEKSEEIVSRRTIETTKSKANKMCTEDKKTEQYIHRDNEP